MKALNRVSKIVSPWQISFSDKYSVSLSQKLLKVSGLIQFNDGLNILTPLLVKSLGKLKEIVRKEMKEISALEFNLPVFTKSEFLQTSGRHDLPDLFKVNVDENKSYVLSPTCEEATCHFIKSFNLLNYKHLPIRVYQISLKFRNEKRPRSGLLRAREFLMKDLYCFDSDDDSCEQCYQEVVNQYHHFFNLLKVPYICATGSTGNIGGLKSHEFHFLAEAGQDRVILCQDCGHNVNEDFIKKEDADKCQECKSNNITVKNGIEVGHTFKLGTTFTKPFEATYLNKNKVSEILHMSSFGLGLTRILAASLEVLSKPDAIVWPVALAPYLVCIVPPKAGSKEEKAVKDESQLIYHNLNQILEDDVIMDDRTSWTIGKRIRSNSTLGFPIQIVLGKSMCNDPPTVEVIDTVTDSSDFVQIPDINQYVMNKISSI